MRRFRPPCPPDRSVRVAPDPRKGFQWLDLHPFLIFEVHGLPHDPLGRGRVDIRHPSDRSLIPGSGCPDPWIAEGSDMRMTAIGWPCLQIRVTPELKAWEPQPDDERPGVSTFTKVPGCPGSKVGETLDRAFLPLRTSLQVPGCPETVYDGCSGRATSIGCPISVSRLP